MVGTRCTLVIARYRGSCIRCRRPINPGDAVAYHHGERKTYCLICARLASMVDSLTRQADQLERMKLL